MNSQEIKRKPVGLLTKTRIEFYDICVRQWERSAFIWKKEENKVNIQQNIIYQVEQNQKHTD